MKGIRFHDIFSLIVISGNNNNNGNRPRGVYNWGEVFELFEFIRAMIIIIC